jgi:hypothetical protein
MAERFLDVSELEAPEPLVQAIEALQSLGQGEYLHFCHRMKPCHLYGFLDENGFRADTRHGNEYECEVFIWRDGDVSAAAAAAVSATVLEPWSGE